MPLNTVRNALILMVTLMLTSCGGGGGGGGGDPADPVLPQIEPGALRLSGSVAVSSSVAVDIDTNDPGSVTSGQDNDSAAKAQLIPNPVIVGGYLNRPGFGPPGASAVAGDVHDFYRVNLLAGQTISLRIADYSAGNPLAVDFDLLLADIDRNLVDFAAGFQSLDELVVSESGEYFIVATVCASQLLDTDEITFAKDIFICGDGASNYTLTVGQGGAPSGAASLRLSDDFVPGEAVARYLPDAAQASGPSLNAVSSAAAEPADAVRLVRFPSAADVSAAVALTSPVAPAVSVAEGERLKVPAELVAKLQTIANIRQLQRSGEVAWAEPNFIRRSLDWPSNPDDPPDDQYYHLQWHYPLINLPAAWAITTGDPNVTVAVIDTGVLTGHPDLQSQVIDGADFISNLANANDGDGPDPDANDPGDNGSFNQSSTFHGTHVAGTIAASTNNGVGVAGVAPNVRIMPVRALGRFGGTSFDIRQSICYAAALSGTGDCPALPANSGITANLNPVDIINLSLGGGSASEAEQEVIDQVVAAGVIVVAAAGNQSSSVKFYPAAYNGVIAVSATTIQNELAPYSSYGSYIDVAAPGGSLSRDIDGDGFVDGVLSTAGNDSFVTAEYGYRFFQGTSMAAPHVAGVLALMKSVAADLDGEDIEVLLEAGSLTDRHDEDPWDQYFGYGLINAQKAVAAVQGGPPPTPHPRLGISPRALNFGATLESLKFSLRNNAGGELLIESISSNKPWLLAPAANGLGNYTLQVDRDGLDEGTYAATLTVVSNINTVTLPVIMQVSNLGITGDAGHLHVRLVDPVTGAIRETEADVSDGVYSWSIDNLPPGQYQLFAFSDADNDGALCDAGEACGAYLTTDQPKLIDLQGDLAGRDFTVNYDAILSGP